MPSIVADGIGDNHRVAKRQKLDAVPATNGAAKARNSSKIFSPFRTVGLVSPTDVPFATQALGKSTFQITTSVGRALQTYDLRKGLQLVFVTRPQTPQKITATTAWKKQILAAWGGEGQSSARGVWVFERGKVVGQLETPEDLDENIKQLLVFGTWIVGCCNTRIEVWKSTNLEHYTTLSSSFAGSGGFSNTLTGGICSIPTYLNKIFAGRENGSVEIWNVNTGKLVFTIYPQSSDWGAVTALQPAPALSLLAIAYETGPVNIHDVRYDRVMLSVSTGSLSKLAVSSISFRTDGLGAGEDGRKEGVMATASKTTGDVTFWDLNNGGRKMGVLRGAHNPPSAQLGGAAGGISKVEFLAGQAVIVTSGLDNSLRTWIFDESPFSPIPRTLHSRSGHAAPISTLQFLPSDADGAEAGGKWLLSASKDRSLWGLSLRRDAQNAELSQGHIQKKAKKMGVFNDGLASFNTSLTLEDLKAPMITCMACSLNRDGGMGAIPSTKGIWNTNLQGKSKSDTAESNITGWESVVTGHEGDKMARTWFWGRRRAGRWAFPTGDGGNVSAVAISPCGTFALIGSATGSIDMYNLQSGIKRGRFPAPMTSKQAERLKVQIEEETIAAEPYYAPKKFLRGQGKHTKAVTGLAVDSLNQTVISCGEDGKVKFWDFASGILIHEMDWAPIGSIMAMRYHRPSDLVALTCDDSSLRIIDIETKKVIRELFSPTGQIVDFTFSNDSRWIIAATSTSLICVWDLPTGHLIDAIKLPSPCTALAFSNTGEFLATAHVDSVGVNVWTNRTLFTHVPTRSILNKDVAELDMPSASGEGGLTVVAAAYALDGNVKEEDDGSECAPLSVDQLNESMTTLSLVPKSRWQNLLHLDLIRERNKPKEAPKAPEKAPFFLPSLSATGAEVAESNASPSQDLVPPTAGPVSRVTKSSLLSAAPDTFTKLLASFSNTSQQDPTALITHLSTLPPSAADIAIRSLIPTELPVFISTLAARLHQRRDYELVQTWMNVCLKVHGQTIAADEKSIESLRKWRSVQERENKRLGRLVGYCNGVVGYLRSAR